jgi:hypothetical protein
VRSIYADWGRAALKTVRTPLSLDSPMGLYCNERLGLTESRGVFGV